MTHRLLSPALLAAVLSLSFTSLSRADIVAQIGPFDEAPNFSGSYPTSLANLGDFSLSLPAGFVIGSVTISGTFGNNDIPGTTDVTADSDYYIDGSAIKVAACDSPDPSNPSLACDAGSVSGAPTPWSYTLTAPQVAAITPLLHAGSLDFNVIQNYYGAVETGQITLDIAPAAAVAPEPATLSLLAFGLAGIALLRRRKA